MCCIVDATLWHWAGKRDVASPWKGRARNWVGRRDVATPWKGGTKGLVSRMHHLGRVEQKNKSVLHQQCNTGAEQVGKMLHQRRTVLYHLGRAEQKSRSLMHQRCNTRN